MPTQEAVRHYYGQELQSSADLRTNACCEADAVPAVLRPLLARIHPEVSRRYYGCGLICPPLLEGCRILDLGCGAGRDVYLLAQLVGEKGEVVGVDMTPEQLAVARAHQAFHAEAFGYDNVRFLDGTIERLEELPLEGGGFDVVVSNCVLNLSTDKAAVLRGVRRLLRSGGEFYFSDIQADRRVAPELRNDPVLYGECLGGALYWPDFLRLARQAGFPDVRLVHERPLEIGDAALTARLGNIQFHAATVRLFRIDGLEETCEDHGQVVVYRGTLAGHPHGFDLDDHHHFETGRAVTVCGNSYRMLAESRFAPHFQFVGDFSRHFGPFPGCGGGLPFRGGGRIAQGGAAQKDSGVGDGCRPDSGTPGSGASCC
jgi:arsenite methyltransferase